MKKSVDDIELIICSNEEVVAEKYHAKILASEICGTMSIILQTERDLRIAITLEDVKKIIKKVECGCLRALKTADGKCRGFQKSRWEDEAIERCKKCAEFELFE